MHSAALAPSPSFQEDLGRTVLQLRGALTDLLASVAADPNSPQVMSRHLGLDKTLAWKVARLVTVADPLASLDHLPGSSGLGILLEAATSAGAPGQIVERVRCAREAFDRLVEVHGGDRSTFDAMLTWLSSAGHQRKRAEAARRQSFLGNSATWGLQARVRVGLHLVAPCAADSRRVDTLNIGALHDLRRLHADIRWPLVIHKTFVDDRGPGAGDDEAMERVEDDGAPLIREFCSTPLPTLRALDVPNGTAWELCPGPVGRTADMTATFGFLRRGVAWHGAATPGEVCEHLTMLNTPVEHLLIDLLVHRSLPTPMPPEALLASRMESDAPLAGATGCRYLLPLHEALTPIGSVVSTPLLPRHPELVAMAVERLGRELDEFQGYRLVLRYPPIPTVAILRQQKPTSGGASTAQNSS